MTHPIDIFQLEADGVRWLGAAPTLEVAKTRIKEFALKSPGEYVVLDQRSGNKVVFNSDDAQGGLLSDCSEKGSTQNSQES
jgi:hypothetical protein